MFWHDIKAIRKTVNVIFDRTNAIQHNVVELGDVFSDVEQRLQLIVNKFEEKFDDYSKNVEKLNSMVNELKGCVALARASLADKKELQEMAKIMLDTAENKKAEQDATTPLLYEIYKVVCGKPKKKSPTNKMEEDYAKATKILNEQWEVDIIDRKLLTDKKRRGRPNKVTASTSKE